MIEAIVQFCQKQGFELNHAQAMANLWADDPQYWNSRTLWALSDAASI